MYTLVLGVGIYRTISMLSLTMESTTRGVTFFIFLIQDVAHFEYPNKSRT